MMKYLTLIFAVITTSVTLAHDPSPKDNQKTHKVKVGANEDYRLPNNTVPINYSVWLVPYTEENYFEGKVVIEVTVVAETSTIVLHVNQLEISSVAVTSDVSVPAISTTVYDQDLQFYTFTFATALTLGNYSLDIEYTGQLRNDSVGFYKSYYNTSSGEIKWYVSSFFAPIYARQAFPCFDEPAFKAHFTISIAHWPDQVAISNALDEYVSEPNSTIGNRVWTKFYTTPLMSTYLVAFMVSDFEYVANTGGSFRIWSRPEAVGTASYSLAGELLLDNLSTFIGINYNESFPKMDQVALPTSATTAMENWGLITYRERWLLWQDGVSTTRDKQNIETVGAHEFAHQWFGNLVTPEWWSYVWLSEGFATFFEYYTAAQVNPSWRLMEQFTVDIYHAAMLADSSDDSRPINEDVYSPDEVKSVFDVISYYKGGSIIRMLLNFLGEPVFQKGLQTYQANNSYGTGTPEKLWDALKEANDNLDDSILIGHVDIKTVMDTWTNQKGYPLITVTRNYTTETQTISQERFLLKGRGSSNDTTEYRWWIPLNVASQSSPSFNNTRATAWIRAQDESVFMSSGQTSDWVICNLQQTGFYRVNYDEQNWNLISEYLLTSNFTNISPINRAQLIDDAFNLARAGYLSYNIALSLTRYLRQETDHVPWTAAFNAFAHLDRMLARSTVYANFQSYIFSRVSPIHNSLGYTVQDGDEHVTSFLRANSHSWACRMGCPGCNSQSQQLVQDFYNSGGNTSIAVDLRAWAYCEGLRIADANVWNFMWERYLETNVAGEQALILSGLGCSLDENILLRYLTFSITENSGLRSHDRLAAFTSVYSNSPSNVDVALQFLFHNIANISLHYGGLNVVGNLLQNLATHLVSESQLVNLETLISEYGDQLGEAASSAQRAIEITKENINWLDTYEGDITQWLENELSSAGNLPTAFGPIILCFMYGILNLYQYLKFLSNIFKYLYCRSEIKNRMTLMKIVLQLALLVAIAFSSPVPRTEVGQFGIGSRVDGDYRLPNNTAPLQYNITLVPYIVVGNFTFDGTVDILLQVLEATSTITLHTNALTYNESLTKLVNQNGSSINVTSHTYDTAEQFLIIGVASQLSIGNYTLSFTYVGVLDSDMYGFYRSSYTNASGDTVWLATTQFEPTSARRAFPCYDEPALKATFAISIKHEPELHALSNMPINYTYEDSTDGKIWTVFETTPIMPTYLVAFVVSDFIAIKSDDETYNVWTKPPAIDQAQYVFDIGRIELAELENYTNISYMLPKMDQISIPDFSAGAMENWGLVTYRESMFLYEENVSTLSTKRSIATVISHEFGHQWFGNLVSPAWWKYLWLNEGFATYFQYYTTDVAEDNWRLMEQFVVIAQQATAFVSDASATSHPMNQDVASPSEISAIFDNISYRKAACVIRMMSHFLTEEVFKAGLTKYLNKMAYSAATSDDLFEALDEAESEAYILPTLVYVADIMETWVEQMGYPVVTVTRNYTTGTTEITQARFLLGDADSSDTHDYKWWIPINWAVQSSPDFSSTVAADWIRSQDESIIISSFNASGWVIFNKQQTGYYRVNYDDTNWGMIANYLNSDEYLAIHVLNRAALIDDALNLARANLLSYSVVLDVTLYLQREVDYVPWYAAFTGLSYLHRVFANTDEYESFRTYFAFLTSNVFETVGIEESSDDEHMTTLNRINVINYACNFGLQSCRSSAEEKLINWLDNSTVNPIAPNLLTNTICAGLRGANSTTWNRALNKYLTTESSTEKTALLAGLGCSENESIINNWMSAIINSTTGLTTSTSSSAFIYVYQGSPYNVDRAFDFLVDNVNDIVSYFGSNSTVQTFLTGTAYRMTTQTQLDKLNAFITAQSAILGTAAATAIEYAESNIAWNTAYEEEVRTWLVATLAELEATATETYETTTFEEDHDESSAATASLNFCAALLIFVCLVQTN
ncbi:uncharacterized protein LOC107222622 [Neodiprion lecontei]|uniref:Uncharacterized protein LOC107222622 n=1 Tax=Neodiprion lecontei TaxID=441921 RepID=A0A6J0BRX5_NEOLC|nr:uncharacterized protein LOC107222622 [Neodiprion lecontei]